MDSASRKQQKRRLSESLEMSSPNSAAAAGGTGRDDELQKTPSRNTSGRVGKRKLQTTPTTIRDEDKTPSAKKRRSSSTQGIGSPSSMTTPLKPALTERQQLALLLQMTDPQKTPGGSSVESSPRDTPTRSRIHRKNERGETPLHLACIKGDRKAASSLIQQGADVNATDFAGWTPLHEACNHGYNDVVVLLIDSGAYVNASGMGGDTPLHDAVVNNHVEVVELLLKHEADSTVHNDNGQQPLDVCRDKKVSRLLRSAMGEQVEGDEDREEKDSDEDVFLSKSETSGPSSPISMPSLDSQTSEHVSNTSTTPVIKKPELQSVPAIHTPRRPTSPQRKSSHGSFYSDISSETDHEHSHQGIAPPSGNLETTPTARTTLTASDEQKCQVSNKAKAQASSNEMAEDTGRISSTEKKEEKHHSPVEKPAAALFPPGVRRSLVHSMKEEEKEDTSESMDVSREPHTTMTDASPPKEDTAAKALTHGDTEDQPLTEQDSQEQRASSITSTSPTSPTLTSSCHTLSPPSSPLSLTVSVSLNLLPQRRVASEPSIHKDMSHSSKLLRSSDIALRRIKDRERRSASVGMTPSLLDEDTRDGSYQSLSSRVSRQRMRRQGSVSLDSSAAMSRQDSFAFEDDDSSSTVVSLPLLFSSRLQQSPSPSHHGSSPCLVTRDDPKTTPLSLLGHGQQKDELIKTTPSTSSSSLASSLTQTIASSKTSPILPSSTITSGSIYKDKEEEHPLPPKKQLLRPVVRSMVVQQRQQSASLPPPPSPLPHNISSFLLTTQQYRTRCLPHPIDPKCVYPPIPAALHKLFTNQETERIALLTSHLTDLDRIVLSFEQALIRAHQRAAVRGYPPLSACSVLLERMMPTAKTNLSNLENTCLNTFSEDKLQSVGDSDEKLLMSYVRDVWDRFHGCSKDLFSRHHLEEETLWLTQAHQWRKALSGGGESASIIIPSSHVPLAHRGNYPNHTLLTL